MSLPGGPGSGRPGQPQWVLPPMPELPQTLKQLIGSESPRPTPSREVRAAEFQSVEIRVMPREHRAIVPRHGTKLHAIHLAEQVIAPPYRRRRR